MMMMMMNFGNFDLNDSEELDLTSNECCNDRSKIKSLKETLDAELDAKRKIYERIQSSTPTQRPLKDNKTTLEQFNQQQAQQIGCTQLKTNYITSKRHSSVVSLNSLKRILLNDMLMNTIHYGSCLECESIAQPYYDSGMHLLVRDSDGNIENLIVYNYESKFMLSTDPKWLIPVGTKLIIKEPHLQFVGLDEHEFAIRVDSPTDLVIVQYPQVTKSPQELLNEANQAYENNEWYHALRVVSQVIETKSAKPNTTALLLRVKTNIKLEKYYAAYQDAKQAATCDKSNFEAHFLMGKSAYLMRKFQLALDAYEQAAKLSGKNKEVELEIKRSKQRLDEARTGNYDFKYLYDEYFRKESLFMDIGDYESNKVEITDIENKSKGVIAKEFIPKGTLLLVNKASSCVFHNQVDYRFKCQLMVNFYEDSSSTRNECENFQNLIYKMCDDPDFARQIYALHAGSEFSREPYDEFPTIDVKRIENIYGFNSFEIKNPIAALEALELQEDLQKAYNLDEEDYSEIDLESLSFESEYYSNLAKLQTKFTNLNNQSGLWYLSAFFNHACHCNSLVRTIGDVHVLYAYKDIPQGDEVTIRYFPAEWAYTERIKRSTEIYGFRCACDFCQQEESDPMRVVREQLLQQIDMKNSCRMVSVVESIADVQKMRYTYANKHEAPLQLVVPLQILADKYAANYNYKQAAKCYEELFELLKDFNPFGAITVLKEAYKDYVNACMEDKSDECKQKAFDYFDSLCFNKIYAEKLWEKIIELCKFES